MKNSINLIDYKGKSNVQKNDKKQRTVRLVAVSLLFVVSAFSIIFFILILLSPLPELKKQTEKAKVTLSLSSEEIIKQEVVKERLGSIKGIIEKRSSFDKLLDYLSAKIPSGVDIVSLSIEKNKLALSLKSKSLQLVDNFLNEITNEESGKKFSKIDIISLSNTDESFTINLAITTL